MLIFSPSQAFSVLPRLCRISPLPPFHSSTASEVSLEFRFCRRGYSMAAAKASIVSLKGKLKRKGLS